MTALFPSKRILPRLALSALLVSGFLGGLCAKAFAYPMPHEKLPDLVLKSSDIIEGTVVRRHERDDQTHVMDVRVEKTYKGALKPGETAVIEGSQTYRKPGSQKFTNTHFENNDRVFLFLSAPEICRGMCIYGITLSGLKWITRVGGEEKAVDSIQYDNPGPYVADPSRFKKSGDLPAAEKLRESISEIVRRGQAQQAQGGEMTQIVRTKEDVKRLDGQKATVVGTYRRNHLPVSARPNAKTVPTQKAEIVLADGTAVFLYPLWDKQSQRTDAELEKNEGKKVEIAGTILHEQGNDPAVPQAARIVGPCVIPDHDLIHQTSGDPVDTSHFPSAATRSDVEKLKGKKVILVGRYETDPEAAPTSALGDPDSQGIVSMHPGRAPKKAQPYRRARIMLKDGESIFFYDPLNKQSLRSPQEHETYGKKAVEVVGILDSLTDGSGFFIIPEKWRAKSGPWQTQ